MLTRTQEQINAVREFRAELKETGSNSLVLFGNHIDHADCIYEWSTVSAQALNDYSDVMYCHSHGQYIVERVS